MSPLEGVRARTLFILGTSLVTMPGLGPDHKSQKGNCPKATLESPETQFWRGERARELVNAIGEPRYT